VELLDNTLLSNFVHVNRLDLVAIALPEASTTPQVMAELNEGETSGRLSASNWSWLTVVSLSPEEVVHFEQLRLILDDGEASCLAVALSRKGTLFSDDRDARRYAQKLGVTVSGTLGVLTSLVRSQHLILAEADNLLQAMIQVGYYSPVDALAEIYDFGE
jgi:predicted nucleic acid-binding protein